MRWMMATCALTSLLASPAMAQNWTRSWEIAMQGAAPDAARIADLRDHTLRQVVRVSIGGSEWRLRLSNEKSPAALNLGTVHVALQDANGTIIAGSDRTLRFSGQEHATITAGSAMDSDPIALPLAPLASVVISIYFPDAVQAATFHGLGSATGLLAPGDQTNACTLQNAQTVRARVVIEAIDVGSSTPQSTVVAFGDSITDGAHSTPDANRRWPDLLAERLQTSHIDVGVANAGIGGNQILHDGAGASGLSRFDQDALSVPGVTHVVVLEGINDIGIPAAHHEPEPTPKMLIAGYRQFIARAHARGVKVILGTLLPYKGAKYWSAEGDKVRQSVNQWIRTSGEADTTVDFERALADPSNPLLMRAMYDSGDGLHPNDAGYKAMADAVDLAVLH